MSHSFYKNNARFVPENKKLFDIIRMIYKK